MASTIATMIDITTHQPARHTAPSAAGGVVAAAGGWRRGNLQGEQLGRVGEKGERVKGKGSHVGGGWVCSVGCPVLARTYVLAVGMGCWFVAGYVEVLGHMSWLLVCDVGIGCTVLGHMPWPLC